MSLPEFSLPLPPDCPPVGYEWEEREMSVVSTTSACNTGIDQRDVFLGRRRCIICGLGDRPILQHCHIIRQSEEDTWMMLKRRHWIPPEAKEHPSHEPRNGLLMCMNHHAYFNSYTFFIRFCPNIRKFIFVNYSGMASLAPFHGKAIALDIHDRHAPFPCLFIIHEMRVRGFHPFQPVIPVMPVGPPWQDWLISDGVINAASDSFFRDANNEDGSGQPQLPPQPMTGAVGDTGSVGDGLALNADVISDILAATHAMPSWRACQMENTSWDGTAEENAQKYISQLGLQDD